jgi:hypothetical protein
MEQDPKDCKTMGPAADLIMSKPPVWNPDRRLDRHVLLVLRELRDVSGRRLALGTCWARKMTDAAVKTQLKDGNARGLVGSDRSMG